MGNQLAGGLVDQLLRLGGGKPGVDQQIQQSVRALAGVDRSNHAKQVLGNIGDGCIGQQTLLLYAGFRRLVYLQVQQQGNKVGLRKDNVQGFQLFANLRDVLGSGHQADQKVVAHNRVLLGNGAFHLLALPGNALDCLFNQTYLVPVLHGLGGVFAF